MKMEQNSLDVSASDKIFLQTKHVGNPKGKIR